MRRLAILLLLLAVAGGTVAAVTLVTSAGDEPGSPARTTASGPVLGGGGEDEGAVADLGFPAFATKNTTRIGGADAVANAAAAALAVFPSREPATRPGAVALVDRRDWRVAISAAQFMAPPLRAPMLFTDAGRLPPASDAALDRLAPAGAERIGGAQIIRVGDVARVGGLRTEDVAGAGAAEIAARIDRLMSAARRRPSPAVMVAPERAPQFAMPAAAWAAKSGTPVLWASRDELPAATRRAIIEHQRPRVYVIGPESAIGPKVAEQLGRLTGEVRRIAADDPVRNAIAFARYSDGSFGWNVVDPGHGLVFASAQRTLDAPAAAPLSASGTYGPLLLVPSAGELPKPLQDYLLDIQPGYDRDPVRGVYNRGWIIGDDAALAVDVQARLDTLLEIQQVDVDSTP